MAWTVWLFLGIAFYLWVHFELPILYLKRATKSIPGPPPLPFLGNVIDIARHPTGYLGYLVDQCNKYNGVFKIQLSRRITLILTDPEDIEVFIENLSNFFSFRYIEDKYIVFKLRK